MRDVVLALGDPDRIRVRYPERVWCDGALVEVVVAADGEPPSAGTDPRAVIVDGDAALARPWLAAGVPVLLAPAMAHRLHADGGDELAGARWACWSPVAFAPEVVAARAALADDRIGPLVGADVVVPVGLGPLDDARWEPDAGCALDTFEAVVFGLDLLRQLDLAVATGDGASTTPPGAERVVRHQLDGGVVVQQRVCDAAHTPVPGHHAELRGRRGRMLLRGEMAPSALTVWDDATATLHCPALPKTKPNIQSPDTARGGPETAQQLAEVVAGRTPAPSELVAALDLVNHAARCAAELDQGGTLS